MIHYCRPFSDSSGEQFFLRREWHKTLVVVGHGKKKKSVGNEWQESKVNYVFDNEMSRTCLIKKLNWIGKTNDLMENFLTTPQNGNDNGDDDDDDDDNDNDADHDDGRSDDNNEGDGDQYVSP